MMGELRPYSKEQQLGKKKDTPQYKKKRYPEKKKKKRNPLKPEVYKGRVIPKKSVRGRILATEYNEALRNHGETCFFCGSPNIEMHHVMPKGYSKIKNGRGIWRNLRALCPEHHRGKAGVHQNKAMMEHLQQVHESLYGSRFFQDRFDLFKASLIPNTTKEAYEKFMLEQE